MLRFTIRELVLLTVIAAIGVAWRIDQRQLRIQNSQYREELVRAKHQMQELETRIDLLAEARHRLI